MYQTLSYYMNTLLATTILQVTIKRLLSTQYIVNRLWILQKLICLPKL